MAAVMERPLLPGILAQPRPAGWEPRRRQAEAALERQDWPSTRQEGWKYTDLAALKAMDFTAGAALPVDIGPMVLPEARGSRLVFVNGAFSSYHSNTSSLPPGVRLLNLAACSELAHELGSLAAPAGTDPFADLNTARFRDGALVVIPKGVHLEAPLHVLFVAAQEGAQATCSLPRLFLVLERGASATVVEEYQGKGRTLTCAVTEVIVRQGASLNHERIQRESPEAYHFSSLAARVERDGQYACRTISFGARLSRCTPRVTLAEEGANLILDGLALLGETQVADTHSFIDHIVPHCTSRQTHKTIADGASLAVFNGIIYVRQDAQGTDAQQQCRGLLLSTQARVDAKPQLEIYADDVKCAHGAAIGQLDPEALFYLQSRGLRPALARNLLTYAFASDLLAGIPVPSLKRQLRQTVLARTNAEHLETLT
ncbi:MAG: Fe-S cluster assembly protein SufD [Holophaga sp.]|nr:Fe-S cluster assembly protein SufD [Holophaga sp.]